MSPASSGLAPGERAPRHVPRATRRHLIYVALRVATFTLVLATLYALAPLDERVDAFIIVELGVLLLLFLLIVAWELREIIRSSYPAIQAVEAVTVSIPMLVLTFSVAYVELARENARSFSQPVTRIDAVYFSVTVFSTVGFGDIVATTQAARLVVTFQMLADLILVGFIAKVLVGAVQRRRQVLDTAPTAPEQGLAPLSAENPERPPPRSPPGPPSGAPFRGMLIPPG